MVVYGILFFVPVLLIVEIGSDNGILNIESREYEIPILHHT